MKSLSTRSQSVLTAVLAASLFAASCGGGSPEKVDVAATGSTAGSTAAGSAAEATGVRIKRKDIPERPLEVKSAVAVQRGNELSVRLADFELNPTSDMISVPPDKVAVYLDLQNQDNSPVAAGQEFTLPATNGHQLSAMVVTTSGVDADAYVTKGSQTTPVGSVKVLSIEGDQLTGEANLDNGEAGIKGKFTAKIHKR